MKKNAKSAIGNAVPIALKLQDNARNEKVNGSGVVTPVDSSVQFKGNRKKGAKKSNLITAMANRGKFYDRAKQRKRRPKSHRRVFSGFCGCRDLGNYRICYKCKTKH